MILAVKTNDDPAEIYLLSDTGKVVKEKKWPAERRLATELPGAIEELVGGRFDDVTGLVVFAGPGSFTGLRIGVATMNALAYGLGRPIVGAGGDNWLKNGQKLLSSGENHRIVQPEYGAPANITKPKK